MTQGSVYHHISSVYGTNVYEVDEPLKLTLRHFLKKTPDLSSLGAFAGGELYEVADYVDKLANPLHVMWSIRGERVDAVLLDPAQRWVLEKLMHEYKVNQPPFKGGSWHEHFAAIYLVSDPGIACILTVTIQTAYALAKYGDSALKRFIPHLIGEAEPIMYGATWFTEIQGGSDLGANLTKAVKTGDSWRLSGGWKYFASNAGLADVALVTARPEGAPPGVKGLGLFLVPRTRPDGSANFTIRRLKLKSATKSVPTGEVEFNDTVAYPVGELEKGIYYVLEDLMVSRLANSAGALGIARKAFLEALGYAQFRRAFGKKLIEHPLVVHDLLEMELLINGGLALMFKAIQEFQSVSSETPPYSEHYHYARLLTHITKNITAEAAAYVTRLAMELHGGLGFLEEFPVERLHREALITPIWEGTSNIQALDMLEAIVKKKAHMPLLDDMRGLSESEIALNALKVIEGTLGKIAHMTAYEVEFHAKRILETIGHAIATILTADMGIKLGDESILNAARLYYAKFVENRELTSREIDAGRELITRFLSP